MIQKNISVNSSNTVIEKNINGFIIQGKILNVLLKNKNNNNKKIDIGTLNTINDLKSHLRLDTNNGKIII